MTAPLAIRYRPSCWGEVVGQADAIKQLRLIESRSGLEGRAYFFSGRSGCGKSTLAYLVAHAVASDWMITELDATRLTVAKLADLEQESNLKGFMEADDERNGRAFIVNEAHGLDRKVVAQLLVMLERIPKHVVWLFTTTERGQAKLFEGCIDAHPLLSRCIVIALPSLFGKPCAERVREIAQREGLDGKPIEAYLELGAANDWNMRAMLQSVEAGCMMV